MTKQAIVTDVVRPSVAHDGYWQITVIYKVKHGTFTGVRRKQVFSKEAPKIGDEILVEIL